MNSNRLWIALPAFGLLSLTSLVGCWGPTYGEIEGRVTRGGVPLEHVQVVFYPEKGGPRSWALTDKDGRFEAMTDAVQKVPARKGAPVGKYCIALVDMDEQIRDTEQMVRVGVGQPGFLDPNGILALPQEKKKKTSGSGARVPAQYNQRLDTPFHDIEIKPGKNWFDLDVKMSITRGSSIVGLDITWCDKVKIWCQNAQFATTSAKAPVLWPGADGPLTFLFGWRNPRNIGEAEDACVLLGHPGHGRGSTFSAVFCTFLPKEVPILATLLYADKEGKERRAQSELRERC